jgi:hypothetical protein
MKSKASLMTALFGAAIAAVATSSDGAMPTRQRAIVNFDHPTLVGATILVGRYMVVHDADKMARGEPCTTLYPDEPIGNARRETVSFMCVPWTRTAPDRFTIDTTWDAERDLYTLTAYQFAGDTEAHGVPRSRLAAVEDPAPDTLACLR